MTNTPRMEVHSHTEYSNLRLLDCINTPSRLIQRAVDIGLKGITITDHESLSGHIKVNKIGQELLKTNPDFKVALGNEIYLTKDRSYKQKYYHFILIAKNEVGHKALRELSTISWLNSYMDGPILRVPTLYAELDRIIKKYPNSLIATTACIGGELSSTTLALIRAEESNNTYLAEEKHQEIVNFVLMCKNWFGEDFYIECAPSCYEEQIKVNKRLVKIAKAFGVKMVIGTDAHYLTKDERYVHKAYLNSLKDESKKEREVDSFYQYSYLQDEDEIREHLHQSDFSNEFIDVLYSNSMEIYDKIKNYSLLHTQEIPKVPLPNISKINDEKMKQAFPILGKMLDSNDNVDRNWVNRCINSLKEKNLYTNEYLQRLEEEADIKQTIGEKLNTNMFQYPLTLAYYVNTFWECGSTVGAGRGSSCSGLNHYLLDITQLNPVKWSLPFYRYLNKERTELGDIDIDLCPSKRPLILNRIKEERGKNFDSDITDIVRRNCGCSLVATFGTEATRAAIATACRGYRSPKYPNGIDIDEATYLTSLIPSERGITWTIEDAVYGNPEKGRKPVKLLIDELKEYDGLLDIILGIKGLIKSRGSHASGVILFDEDPFKYGCFMKTSSGDIITQYDLEDAEAAGMIKYDFLVTKIQDKILNTIQLLQENNEINPDLTIKEVYDKYLHPDVLNIDDDQCWRACVNNSVLDFFQFDSQVGSQAVKKIQPSSITELSTANGLMRLMAPSKDEESPMEKYIRYKNNINEWYAEMDTYGLTKEEQKTVEPHFKESYGVPPSQEQLMEMLMDKDICGFTLKEANAARKIVGKKQMSKIPALREKVLTQAKSPCLGNYIWKCGIGPQMGYSFSKIHSLAYSFVGYQNLFLATHWSPIYWNTACLNVNSGALEQKADEIVSIYEEEGEDLADGVVFIDLPDGQNKIKRQEKSTDYSKMAKALSILKSRNIHFSPVDINYSELTFKPSKADNEILFSLKSLNGVGDKDIEMILANRPYTGIKDFLRRCPLKITTLVSLVKSGAFDSLDSDWASEICEEPRVAIMAYLISVKSEPKKQITLSNYNSLLKYDLIPEMFQLQKRIHRFNLILKQYFTFNDYFILNNEALTFYELFGDMENIVVLNNNTTAIKQDVWKKEYTNAMKPLSSWIKNNKAELRDSLNTHLFIDKWNEYAKGNISAWEMDSICFYRHEHELAHVSKNFYGLSSFQKLPATPKVDYYFKRNGRQIPIYELTRIVGTIIGKDKTHSSIDILTPDLEVVVVKFTKDYFAMYNRQISEIQEDGSKKVMEKGWFQRGVKVLITGFRRDDTFVAKKYKATPTHQLYKIVSIDENGKLELQHDRYGTEGE